MKFQEFRPKVRSDLKFGVPKVPKIVVIASEAKQSQT